jgi:hypothetical protein
MSDISACKTHGSEYGQYGEGMIGAINKNYVALFYNPPEQTGGLPFIPILMFQRSVTWGMLPEERYVIMAVGKDIVDFLT